MALARMWACDACSRWYCRKRGALLAAPAAADDGGTVADRASQEVAAAVSQLIGAAQVAAAGSRADGALNPPRAGIRMDHSADFIAQLLQRLRRFPTALPLNNVLFVPKSLCRRSARLKSFASPNPPCSCIVSQLQAQ